MSNVIKKVEVNVPKLPLKDMDLSAPHVTTTNFMQLLIPCCREIPTGKIDADIKAYCKLFPLQKPVLGSGRLSLNAFFVPFRTVWSPFTSFLVDAPVVNGSGSQIMPNVPIITNGNLISAFTNVLLSTQVSSGAYDFSNGSNNYKLTTFGRWCLKTIESLGYKVVFGAKSDFNMSALPLLCVLKAFMDWYFPSQYAHTGNYANMEQILNRDYIYSLTPAELLAIFEAIRFVAYDSDLFTGAFDNPVGGANGTFSRDFEIKDISSFNVNSSASTMNGVVPRVKNSNISPISQGNNLQSPSGTPAISTVVEGAIGPNGSVAQGVAGVPITEYSLHSLMALNDYIARNALAGSRALDRYLARFSKVLSADSLRRSFFLGSSSTPIQFGEVDSQADTTNANGGASLGDYAGKGRIIDEGSRFQCDTDEFGYFLVLASINPDVDYFQGIDNNVFHLSKLDFHTSEFDGIGNTALRVANVGVAMKNAAFNADVKEQIFGYAPRYYEYKTPVAHVTGDFRCDSVNGGLMPWLTARELPVESFSAASDLVHSLDFCMGSYDAAQYSRIFYPQEGSVDNFYIVFRNNLHCAFPVKSLWDTYDWHSDTDKEIKLDVNGAKVN